MSCLWTSEVWSVKGEQQQNYRTIDQGVTSDSLSSNEHRRPSNFQLFPYVAVWMCSGLFWLMRCDAVTKLSAAGRLAVNCVQRPTMYRRGALESTALPFSLFKEQLNLEPFRTNKVLATIVAKSVK